MNSCFFYSFSFSFLLVFQLFSLRFTNSQCLFGRQVTHPYDRCGLFARGNSTFRQTHFYPPISLRFSTIFLRKLALFSCTLLEPYDSFDNCTKKKFHLRVHVRVNSTAFAQIIRHPCTMSLVPECFLQRSTFFIQPENLDQPKFKIHKEI